ncbi:hypothetical protein Tco_0837858 [Tanacetum coccineum]
MRSDGSVNSKPSVTELNGVNDEAFMVDKKYVNVTDLNLVSDDKVSLFDRDDLEKKVHIKLKMVSSCSGGDKRITACSYLTSTFKEIMKAQAYVSKLPQL